LSCVLAVNVPSSETVWILEMTLLPPTAFTYWSRILCGSCAIAGRTRARHRTSGDKRRVRRRMVSILRYAVMRKKLRHLPVPAYFPQKKTGTNACLFFSIMRIVAGSSLWLLFAEQPAQLVDRIRGTARSTARNALYQSSRVTTAAS
jgi:hypothetical protein